MFLFFFFNDTATTEIYPLSLHDALPIWSPPSARTRPSLSDKSRRGMGRRTAPLRLPSRRARGRPRTRARRDRKSTRLNSSHDQISYAVFCLKKKKNKTHSR